MHEKTIEEIISRYPEEVWPGCGLSLKSRQLPLDCGRLDLLMQDREDVLWVVELKRGAFPPGALPALAGYVAEIASRFPAQAVSGLAVGTSFSPIAQSIARSMSLQLKTFDPVALRALAERMGLVLVDARPRPHRSQQVPSVPRGPGSRRVAPDNAKVAALAALDAQFPPSSLRSKATERQLRAYWTHACPRAPQEWVDVAVRLTREVLRLCPNAAVGNRAAGGWTTVLAANGDVVASLDAKRDYVDLGILLPEHQAADLARHGLVTPHHPRRNGRWIKARVGISMSETLALALIADAMAFEYPKPDGLP